MPYWHFIEWANIGRQGEAGIINALYIGALQAAASLAGSIDYGGAKARYQTRATEMSTILNARHWNAARGLYVDCVNPITGEQSRKVSQHTNACMILWGIAPENRWPDLVSHMADREKLRLTAVPPIVTSDQEFDQERHMAQANTFFAHFVYQAFARAGRFDLALMQIRNFYQPMLERGATALWESFEPSASLCHAFSASPVYQLSAHVLGVSPLTPGFENFRVWIQPCDLQQAEGTVATVGGDIKISWYRKNSELVLNITVPGEMTAHIIEPPEYDLLSGATVLEEGLHQLCFVAKL